MFQKKIIFLLPKNNERSYNTFEELFFDVKTPIFFNWFNSFLNLNFLSPKLVVSYRNKNLFLNLTNSFYKTVVLIRPINVFNGSEWPKSIKKSSKIKTLQIFLLKKIMIHLNMTKIDVIFNRNLKFASNLFSVLFKGQKTRFNNLFTKSSSSSFDLSPVIAIKNVLFKKTKSFNPTKLKKKSRLKRKVTRKIISRNNLEF